MLNQPTFEQFGYKDFRQMDAELRQAAENLDRAEKEVSDCQATNSDLLGANCVAEMTRYILAGDKLNDPKCKN